MQYLLKLFFDVLFLRKGPQVLPDARFLLGSVLVLHFLLGFFLYLFALPFFQAVSAALIGTAMTLALVQAVLTVRGVAARVTQTASAVAGTELLLGFAILPFRIWEAAGGNQAVTSVVLLVTLGWSFAVNTHIFRHALSTTTGAGMATAFIYMLISFVVAALFSSTGA